MIGIFYYFQKALTLYLRKYIMIKNGVKGKKLGKTEK